MLLGGLIALIEGAERPHEHGLAIRVQALQLWHEVQDVRHRRLHTREGRYWCGRYGRSDARLIILLWRGRRFRFSGWLWRSGRRSRFAGRVRWLWFLR